MKETVRRADSCQFVLTFNVLTVSRRNKKNTYSTKEDSTFFCMNNCFICIKLLLSEQSVYNTTILSYLNETLISVILNQIKPIKQFLGDWKACQIFFKTTAL